MIRKLLCLVVLLGCGLLAGPVQATLVKDVLVANKGQGEIDQSSVLAFISVKPGDTYSYSRVSEDVRNLQESGRFAFVDVFCEKTPSGMNITYMVRNKPTIRQLTILGAEDIGNGRVRDWLEIGHGDIADDATLAIASQRALDKYRQRLYPYAKITWKIDENTTNGFADVTVTVKEGRRAGVHKIIFEGNQVIKSKDLASPMKQRERNWLSWITGSGTYKPDDVALDVGVIRQQYEDIGYLDAKIAEPIIKDAGNKKIDIIIPVQEGQKYQVGKVYIDGVKAFSLDDVAKSVVVKMDGTASLRDVKRTDSAVRSYYTSRGYIETVVGHELIANPQTRVADVMFHVKEGRKGYIRDIKIKGNTRTKDKVIRRELAVYPDELYSEAKIQTSEQRLRNLGYFETVSSMYESTLDPDYYDLVFHVEEKKTGQFMVGAGFSSIDEVVGIVELSQGNFDLFGWPTFSGGGQKAKARVSIGTKRDDYEISFVEPWFLNRKLSLGVDLFCNENRYYSDEYNQQNVGGSVTLGKALTAYDRLNLKYTLQQIKVYDVSDSASEQIKAESGTRTKSSLTPTLIHDTRDNFFIPTKGNRSEASFELAGGPLGADTDMYGVELRSSQFVPLWFDHVLNIRGWTAVVDSYGSSQEVHIFDRLFLGGPRNLRGFKYRKVGPVDDEDEPLGGNSAYYATAEYEVPVWRYLRLAGYYDMGMVWADSYYYSTYYNSDVGLGLRVDIPGLPLRLDYAWPIKAADYNRHSNGVFSWMIGYMF